MLKSDCRDRGVEEVGAGLARAGRARADTPPRLLGRTRVRGWKELDRAGEEELLACLQIYLFLFFEEIFLIEYYVDNLSFIYLLAYG